MIRYQYAITITLYQYDDLKIKREMNQIQMMLWEYINNDNFHISSKNKKIIITLTNEILKILNEKYEKEWNKQKAEVDGKRFIKYSN